MDESHKESVEFFSSYEEKIATFTIGSEPKDSGSSSLEEDSQLHERCAYGQASKTKCIGDIESRQVSSSSTDYKGQVEIDSNTSNSGIITLEMVNTTQDSDNLEAVVNNPSLLKSAIGILDSDSQEVEQMLQSVTSENISNEQVSAEQYSESNDISNFSREIKDLSISESNTTQEQKPSIDHETAAENVQQDNNWAAENNSRSSEEDQGIHGGKGDKLLHIQVKVHDANGNTVQGVIDGEERSLDLPENMSEVNQGMILEEVPPEEIRIVLKHDPEVVMEKFQKEEKLFTDELLKGNANKFLELSARSRNVILQSRGASRTIKRRSLSTGQKRKGQTVGLDHLDNLVKLMEQLSSLREENIVLRQKCNFLHETRMLLQVHNHLLKGDVGLEEPSVKLLLRQGLQYAQDAPKRSKSMSSITQISDEDKSLDITNESHLVGKSDTMFSKSKITSKWKRVKRAFKGKHDSMDLGKSSDKEHPASPQSSEKSPGFKKQHASFSNSDNISNPGRADRFDSVSPNPIDSRSRHFGKRRRLKSVDVNHSSAYGSDSSSQDLSKSPSPSSPIDDTKRQFLSVENSFGSIKRRQSSPVLSLMEVKTNLIPPSDTTLKRSHSYKEKKSKSEKPQVIRSRSNEASPIGNNDGNSNENLSQTFRTAPGIGQQGGERNPSHHEGERRSSRTTWGRVKDIIHTRKESLKRKSRRTLSTGSLEASGDVSDREYFASEDEKSSSKCSDKNKLESPRVKTTSTRSTSMTSHPVTVDPGARRSVGKDIVRETSGTQTDSGNVISSMHTVATQCESSSRSADAATERCKPVQEVSLEIGSYPVPARVCNKRYSVEGAAPSSGNQQSDSEEQPKYRILRRINDVSGIDDHLQLSDQLDKREKNYNTTPNQSKHWKYQRVEHSMETNPKRGARNVTILKSDKSPQKTLQNKNSSELNHSSDLDKSQRNVISKEGTDIDTLLFIEEAHSPPLHTSSPKMSPATTRAGIITQKEAAMCTRSPYKEVPISDTAGLSKVKIHDSTANVVCSSKQSTHKSENEMSFIEKALHSDPQMATPNATKVNIDSDGVGITSHINVRHASIPPISVQKDTNMALKFEIESSPSGKVDVSKRHSTKERTANPYELEKVGRSQSYNMGQQSPKRRSDIYEHSPRERKTHRWYRSQGGGDSSFQSVFIDMSSPKCHSAPNRNETHTLVNDRYILRHNFQKENPTRAHGIRGTEKRPSLPEMHLKTNAMRPRSDSSMNARVVERPRYAMPSYSAGAEIIQTALRDREFLSQSECSNLNRLRAQSSSPRLGQFQTSKFQGGSKLKSAEELIRDSKLRRSKDKIRESHEFIPLEMDSDEPEKEASSETLVDPQQFEREESTRLRCSRPSSTDDDPNLSSSDRKLSFEMGESDSSGSTVELCRSDSVKSSTTRADIEFNSDNTNHEEGIIQCDESSRHDEEEKQTGDSENNSLQSGKNESQKGERQGEDQDAGDSNNKTQHVASHDKPRQQSDKRVVISKEVRSSLGSLIGSEVDDTPIAKSPSPVALKRRVKSMNSPDSPPIITISSAEKTSRKRQRRPVTIAAITPPISPKQQSKERRLSEIFKRRRSSQYQFRPDGAVSILCLQALFVDIENNGSDTFRIDDNEFTRL